MILMRMTVEDWLWSSWKLEIGPFFSDAAHSTVRESTALRRANPGSTPSFPRVTTITTSAQEDALHITMLSEVCGGCSGGKMRRDGVVDGGNDNVMHSIRWINNSIIHNNIILSSKIQ